MSNECEIVNCFLNKCSCEVQCCSLFCLHSITPVRRNMALLKETERNKFLFDKLNEMYNPVTHTWRFFCDGNEVCDIGFQSWYVISKYKMKYVQKCVKEGTVPIHGNKLVEKKAELSRMCETWLSGYLSTYSDHLPHLKEVYLSSSSIK